MQDLIPIFVVLVTVNPVVDSLEWSKRSSPSYQSELTQGLSSFEIRDSCSLTIGIPYAVQISYLGFVTLFSPPR